MTEKGRYSIFQIDPEDLRCRFRNNCCRLVIFQGAASLVGDNLSGRGIYLKHWDEPCRLTTKVLEKLQRLMEPRSLLQIFGHVSHWLGLIAEPERRAAAAGKYYWLGTDVCCGYLVEVHVGSGYLGKD